MKKFLLILLVAAVACSDDDESPSIDSCAQASGITADEANGLLVVEVENTPFEGDWSLRTSIPEFSGAGYLRWNGENQFNNPGVNILTYEINISTPGTYRFIWKSFIDEGDNNTESNDAWLRLPDADNFFAEKNGNQIFPKGSGKTPNPNGAGKDGWFKIYMNKLDEWVWAARTSDNDAHDIYATFDTPGVYTVEISGRSTGFAIDRFALYQEDSYSLNEIKEGDLEGSNFTCN